MSSGRRTAKATRKSCTPPSGIQVQHGAHQRTRRGHRLGRRAGAALPRRARRALLSTQGGDIDELVAAERLAIFKVFLVAAGVMIVLSLLLAGTIAGPVRRLADGAQQVRRRISSRVEIPDFTGRRDEIGHLSGTLRDMTNALYSRIEASRASPPMSRTN